jgi:lipopolysaccharide transport system ATP-binding protein
MKSIIEVKNLSKKYRYGENQPYYTLRDKLASFVRLPLRLLNKEKGQSVLEKGEFWALKDISFKVNRGEAVGFIGPNGAGKSTLLKVLSRITPPTSGQAILRGRVGSLLEVGTGFQQELTGRENIYLNGAILGMTRREITKKFDEIVDFSGVEKFLDTPVKHYSSGMYMRLAFAIAANLETEILIVDEVLAVGDAEFQKKCLGKMDDITKKEGRTILFVSHNLEAVKNLCNRCVLLNKGKKIFEGEVKETLIRYKNLQDNDLIINTGEHDLNRTGSGTLSFTNIEIMDVSNKRRNTFNIGETVRFRVSYKVFEKMRGLNLNIGFFSSKIQGLMLTDVTHKFKKGIVEKGESGTVRIDIQLTSIRTGEYILNFWLGDDAAIQQANPFNYDVVKGTTKPLIIEAKDEVEKRLMGSFSLPSKIISR